MWSLWSMAACAPAAPPDEPLDTATTPEVLPTVPAGPQCPSPSGFDELGRTWTRSYTSAHAAATDESGQWTERVATYDVQDDVVNVVIHTDAAYEIPDFEDYTASLDATYRCDADGLWLLSQFTSFSYVFNGNPREGTVDLVYTEPPLLLPADAGRGSSWEIRARGDVTSTPPGDTTSFTVQTTATIASTAVINVRAGEFPEALAIDYTTDDVTTTEYVADGVGWILTADDELVAYTIPGEFVP
jgi:hypothetical protein